MIINGLMVNAKGSLADGTAERETALAILGDLSPETPRQLCALGDS